MYLKAVSAVAGHVKQEMQPPVPLFNWYILPLERIKINPAHLTLIVWIP
jgi:hypothetical protein